MPYLASAIALLSLFFPWVEMHSWARLGETTTSFSTGEITGISTASGIFGLFLTFLGGYMVWSKNQLAFLVGVVNALNGLAALLVWGSSGANDNDPVGGYAGVQVTPHLGGLVFIAAVLVFVAVTFKSFRGTFSEYYQWSLEKPQFNGGESLFE